ncbi:MAG: OmpA family protein [Alphaproteobacteria bacterium]|nr:OmpA family protein [Alphaproteobacteria bacterium]
MRRAAHCLAAAALLAAAPLVAVAAPDPAYVKVAETDAPKASDSPLTGRYEGAHVLGQTVKAFDELTLPAGPAEGETYDSKKKFTKTVAAEGKVTRTAYVAPLGRSSLEVFRNYKDALVAKGFTPAFECVKEACGPSFAVLKYRWDRKETHVAGAGYDDIRGHLINAVFDEVKDVRYALMKKTDTSGDTYVAVYAGVHVGGSFGSFSEVLRDRTGVLVEIVEPKGMETKMVVLKAEAISGDIATQGRAVFYGIHFDFDKADIKPESEPQLEEMAKVMKANAKLNVLIVGHTDNQGKLDYNTGLSQRRAEAVVKALSSKYGIDAKRMTARGIASLSPVTTNRTDDGRAKNRRVEMVEQ